MAKTSEGGRKRAAPKRAAAPKGAGNALRTAQAPRARRGLPDPAFWSGRRVLLTGQTGFVGGWAALWLERMGAIVTGAALAPVYSPDFYTLARVAGSLASQFVDLRDRSQAATLMEYTRASVVLHLAAEGSTEDSARTFATNVMGTVNLLDALRKSAELEAVLCVSGDSMYGRPPGDPLAQKEPFAASMAARDIALASYGTTHFLGRAAVVSASGGAAVGGGDFAPDGWTSEVLAPTKSGGLTLNPHAMRRPYRHVLDCVAGYLVYLEGMVADPSLPQAIDFGRTDDLASIRERLGFEERLSGEKAAEWALDWFRAIAAGEDVRTVTLAQIDAYEALA